MPRCVVALIRKSLMCSIVCRTGSSLSQIWPQNFDTDIRGTADGIYLIVIDISNGLDFIVGHSCN